MIRPLLLLLTGLGLLACGRPNAESTPTSAVADHDCRYCGMPSDDYPQYNALALTAEGDSLFFCSTRCLLLTHLESGQAVNLERLFVTDYYEQEKVAAPQAFFVAGSDVIGPMGRDLIPHASRAAAEEFRQDHRGTAIYPFDSLDLPLLTRVVRGQ